MLEVIRLPFDEFDLDGFLKGYARSPIWMSEDDAVFTMCVTAAWDEPPMPNCEQVDPHSLLRDGMLLFLTMHEGAIDDVVQCVDGTEVDAEDLGLSVCRGWTLALKENRLEFHPSLYEGDSGPFPRLVPQADCGVMEKPMLEFVSRYIRS